MQIPKNCSISYLSQNFSIEKKIVVEFATDSSFSLGAEGLFVSIFNYKLKNSSISKIKIYLSGTELRNHGIPENSPLVSVAFLNICMKSIPIYDRHDKEVTSIVIDYMNRSINMDEGVYEKGTSFCIYAFDPYYVHPPKLNIGKNDPSEEDFKFLLKEKIESKFIGSSIKRSSSFKEVYNSINLYSFLKEIWENTAHHARRPDASLRYIQISKLIFSNSESLEKMEYPQAINSYLKSREANGNKLFLIFEITDSGEGIYKTLNKSPEDDPHDIVLSAFSDGITSKKERSTIKRGLGLITALKCSEKLDALFILTTSGFIYTNYDKDTEKVSQEIQFSAKINEANTLSTSVSLILPV